MQPDERIESVFERGTMVGLGPAELLERFNASRDEAAFAALVDRHGPMVLATCRRILPERADADDAFQATFLVLARKAGSITDPDQYLAPWLHGVAHRVAIRARSDRARRPPTTGEPARAELEAIAVGPPPDDTFEVRAILDEELSQLSPRYREALVLCYLEGMTHDEAARQLGCPVGTVRSRLAGGRDRLRARLTRRGFGPGALAILSPASLPTTVVSRVLQVATVRLVFINGSGTVTASAAALLAQGVLTSMYYAKFQAVATVTLAVAATFAAGAVGVVVAQQAPAPDPAPKITPTPPAVGQALPDATFPPPAPDYAAAVARIKALEAELAGLRAQPLPTPASKDGFVPTKLASGPQPAAVDPFGGSVVIPVPRSGNVVVAPADRKQITMIDTATGTRATYRPPGSVTRINPIVGQNMVGLDFEGDKVTQLAAFGPTGTEWVTQDLVEPAPGNAIRSMIRTNLAQYLVGRHLYLFGAEANRWAVAELQDPQARERWGQMGTARSNDECIVIPDGDRLHTYNFRTGQLTQTSLQGEPPVARAEPAPASPPPQASPPQTSLPQPEPAPTVQTLEGSPTILMVVSGTRDRITMINPATQGRATLRLGQPAEIIAAVSNAPGGLQPFSNRQDQKLIEGLIGLEIVGPKIDKAAIFDRNAMRWFEHDLPQPASRVRTRMNVYSTLVGIEALYLAPTSSLLAFDAKDQTWPTVTLPGSVTGYTPADVSVFGTVAYEAGRYLPIYNQAARKWSTLEFQANGPRGNVPDNAVYAVHDDIRNPHDGKLLIAEGDVIHIYDFRTAEWTHIDTRNDK